MAASRPTKLTLVVDPAVIRRAKSFASSHDTSVSSLVEAYLSQLTADEDYVSVKGLTLCLQRLWRCSDRLAVPTRTPLMNAKPECGG